MPTSQFVNPGLACMPYEIQFSHTIVVNAMVT